MSNDYFTFWDCDHITAEELVPKILDFQRGREKASLVSNCGGYILIVLIRDYEYSMSVGTPEYKIVMYGEDETEEVVHSSEESEKVDWDRVCLVHTEEGMEEYVDRFMKLPEWR